MANLGSRVRSAVVVPPLVLVVGVGLLAASGLTAVADAVPSTSPHPGLNQTSLPAPGAGTGSKANLGSALAVSGTTLVVGADGQSVNGHKSQGAVYVYRRPADGWHATAPVAKLTNLPGQADDDFGYSVAISGRTIVVGDVRASEGSAPHVHTSQGEVDVYVEPAAGWRSTTKPTAILTVADGGSSDQLGSSVAISGHTIVSGASGYSDSNSEDFEGKAYVFTEPASGWHSTSHPLATLAPTGDCTAFCLFGGDVAINGTSIAVSAPGRFSDTGEVYLFHLPTTVQSAEVNQYSDAIGGSEDEDFGAPVVFAGNTLAVGADGQTVGANSGQGAVFVFNAPAGGWADAGPVLGGAVELYASDGVASDSLGDGLAMSGNTIVASAANRTSGAKAYGFAGLIYVFRRTGPTWTNSTQSAEVGSSTAAFGDYLGGGALALDSTALAAGAPDRNSDAGAAYVFAPPGPVLSGVKQSRATWAAGSAAPKINPAHAPAHGTRFSLTLGQASRVSLAFTEGGKRKGTITFAGKKGTNRVYVDGKTAGGKKLSPGKCVVVISTSDAYGTRTASPLHFTVE